MSDKHDLHDERISKLYRSGSKAQPSEQIDEQIIQTAHATARNIKKGIPWPSLATAAVLVLSISLVLKVLEQKPLEESVMEPMSADDHITQPEVMEQDAEDKLDSLAPVLKDREEARQKEQRSDLKNNMERSRIKQRTIAPESKTMEAETFGASQQKPSPTSVKKIQPKTKRALKEEAIVSPAREAPDFKVQQQPLEAPAFSGSIQKRSMKKLDCSGIQMPETDSVADWSQRYKSALEQGQLREANCLKQVFHNKFGKTMPTPAK